MENTTLAASYIVSLEQRLSALTAERDSLRSTAERLSSERDALQGVVEKMQGELRQLRRMLFGRKSERFIPSDPAQLKLDFEGVAELKQEREYAALQAATPTRHKEPAARGAKSAEERQRRIFPEHLERRDEIIEPVEIPVGGKRIGEEVTELLEYKPGELYIVGLFGPSMLCRTVKESLSENCRRCRCPAPMPGRRCWPVARRQIPGSSAAAPSDRDLRPGGSTV